MYAKRKKQQPVIKIVYYFITQLFLEAALANLRTCDR